MIEPWTGATNWASCTSVCCSPSSGGRPRARAPRRRRSPGPRQEGAQRRWGAPGSRCPRRARASRGRPRPAARRRGGRGGTAPRAPKGRLRGRSIPRPCGRGHRRGGRCCRRTLRGRPGGGRAPRPRDGRGGGGLGGGGLGGGRGRVHGRQGGGAHRPARPMAAAAEATRLPAAGAGAAEPRARPRGGEGHDFLRAERGIRG
jgi:hypothetical protein